MASLLSLLVITVFCSVVLRWSVSLNSYSGQGKPPMFGDYEAQRHWMEITFNLPPSNWYVNSTENDLLYWGLDYPPLTAYHSWLCGWIANNINPEWVSLKSSRGHESYHHKIFMRYTVLVADLAIYIPALIVFICVMMPQSSSSRKAIVSGALLSYPGLILIDHGHFQYNCVSLGLTVWATVFLQRKQECLASAAFVFALNYKQMELYHAFPFFYYLLGLCWKQRSWSGKITLLASIGCTVVLAFAACWLPFLRDIDTAQQVLRRLFPFSRGLYEDKVANVWCSLSIMIKLKRILDVDRLVLICLASTLLACLPSSLDLLFRPSLRKFMYSMINCSLAFFLFSFQVHEKSILIPALSVLMLLPCRPFESLWFLLISTFSMFPLLERDGQSVPYAAATIIFFVLVAETFTIFRTVPGYRKVMFTASIVGGLVLHLAKATVPAPTRFPDLYPVFFSLYSCFHFVLFFLYFNYLQFSDNTDANTFPTSDNIKTKSS